MPEHIRALIVILAVAALAFAVARPASRQLIDENDFRRRRNIWLALVLVSFVFHNLWIYVLLGALILLSTSRLEANKPALFFFLLFIVPDAPLEVPGFGIINYLLTISPIRLLSFCILLPAAINIRRVHSNANLTMAAPDKILLAYLLLIASLQFRETTITNTLRFTFYIFLDVILPYYVISRSLRDQALLNDAVASFVVASGIIAGIAVVEFLKHWSLYAPLIHAMDVRWSYVGYTGRAGLLRATASVGTIPLGYVMVVALGFFYYIRHFIANKWVRRSVHAALLAGLAAPLSRGPWLGAVVLVATFIALGPFAIRRLACAAAAAVFILAALAMLPGGSKVVDLLPFLGSVDTENIDYRQRLLDNASIVIARNPWFGSATYLETPEMEAMRQGQGIIDVVNTYIRVALEAGFVGLTLFVAFFIAVGLGVFRGMQSLPDRDHSLYILGRALLATLLAILAIILTVSSVSVIPLIYWSVGGLGVAYTRVVKLYAVQAKQIIETEPAISAMSRN